MNDYLIICRSITHAQRTSRALQRMGIFNQVFRVPAGLVKSGCGYAVRVRQAYIQQALQTLRQNAIPYQTVFFHDETGYHEVHHDLS